MLKEQACSRKAELWYVIDSDVCFARLQLKNYLLNIHFITCFMSKHKNWITGVKLDKILLRESTNPPKVNDKLGFAKLYQAFKSFF